MLWLPRGRRLVGHSGIAITASTLAGGWHDDSPRCRSHPLVGMRITCSACASAAARPALMCARCPLEQHQEAHPLKRRPTPSDVTCLQQPRELARMSSLRGTDHALQIRKLVELESARCSACLRSRVARRSRALEAARAAAAEPARLSRRRVRSKVSAPRGPGGHIRLTHALLVLRARASLDGQTLPSPSSALARNGDRFQRPCRHAASAPRSARASNLEQVHDRLPAMPVDAEQLEQRIRVDHDSLLHLNDRVVGAVQHRAELAACLLRDFSVASSVRRCERLQLAQHHCLQALVLQRTTSRAERHARRCGSRPGRRQHQHRHGGREPVAQRITDPSSSWLSARAQQFGLSCVSASPVARADPGAMAGCPRAAVAVDASTGSRAKLSTMSGTRSARSSHLHGCARNAAILAPDAGVRVRELANGGESRGRAGGVGRCRYHTRPLSGRACAAFGARGEKWPLHDQRDPRAESPARRRSLHRDRERVRQAGQGQAFNRIKCAPQDRPHDRAHLQVRESLRRRTSSIRDQYLYTT